MRSFAVAALMLTASPSPVPAPWPSLSPSPAPTSSPSPAPSPTPSPSPPPAPPATPAPSPYRVIINPPAPPPGSPAILEIALSDTTLHPGGPYLVRVTTSLDVTTVNVSTMGATYALPAVAPGRFLVSGTVPSEVPFFFFDRSYTLTATALTADGRSTSFQVTLRLER